MTEEATPAETVVERFEYDGETFDLIRKKFTFGEAAALEGVTGLTIGQILEGGPETETVALMQGYIWISIKRKRPTFTFADLDDVGIDDDIVWLEAEAPQGDDEAGEPVGPTSPAPAPDAVAAPTP